ncbi:MAG: ATP-binding protein [Thiobacillus sp.]|nr:ATP-binding protein [Gammaproteobacteria bacterium]MBU4499551.1 ATP-binding protein [Gammaproteobacteria bacterium]MDO9008053.1 ATP-binding protein [Thiobacillus sp.]MDP1924706.1 ATP-binding protein [Thiobacillus sp.]MDP3124746.1 ATP-binding protein [Thiobacillus sp.]
MTKLTDLIPRLTRLLDRLEAPAAPTLDWKAVRAARWSAQSGGLKPILHPQRVALKDLLDIDEQKQRVDANTRQFVAGKPANNVLLTGARGGGKSSLVKAVHAKYAAKGLRLIEVDKAGLPSLPDLFDLLAEADYRFIVFIDDLTFAENEPGYASLKAALDGSLAGPSDNVLIYATSNRRHLMPEYMAENLATQHVGDEVHPGEAIEEKISLSDRFGLWVSFHAMEQDAYLAIARHWASQLGAAADERFERAALQWSLGRGARNGRVAWQFARDWAGRQ